MATPLPRAPGAASARDLLAASQGDPLEILYSVRKHCVLGGGSDGGVVRGVLRSSGEWHALKFFSRSAYSPEREIGILTSLCHPNITRVLGVFEPHGARAHTVLALHEADFTLDAYLQRSRGSDRLTARVAECLSNQLLAGISHLHQRQILHRDLKPQNVLLTLVPGFDRPSAMKLQLADFSRSRRVRPQKQIPVKTTISEHLDLVAMTPNVSTPDYAPPEAHFAYDDVESVPGGASQDIWSYGSILFEMVTGQPFVKRGGRSTRDVLASIVCRLGPCSPNSTVTPYPTGKQYDQIVKEVGLEPLSSFIDTCRCLGGAALLMGSLHWDAFQRCTAPILATFLWEHQCPTPTGDPPDPQNKDGQRVRTPSPSRRVTRSPSPTNCCRDGGKAPDVPEPNRPSCRCSGNCNNKGHMYRGCDSNNLLPNSSFCRSCECIVKGCTRPRRKCDFCVSHLRIWRSLPQELKATHTAMRDCRVEKLVPDVTAFVAHFDRCQNDLCSLLVLGMLSDPAAADAWSQTGVMKGAGHANAGALAESLVAVAVKMDRRAQEQHPRRPGQPYSQ